MDKGIIMHELKAIECIISPRLLLYCLSALTSPVLHCQLVSKVFSASHSSSGHHLESVH